ncbi:hypothetical protein CEXT_144351 [Caerostris extrusa]|uniref:Uncharacterized protein n=1 Tax=Caerostris extrusa TaxID=172846 RepID=A0AAV4Y6Y9_CAEEX|nr:hypothetical protein CEXT_144351 [Caerostris extrusa]
MQGNIPRREENFIARNPFHQRGLKTLNKDALSSHSSGIRSICMTGSEWEPVQLFPLLFTRSFAGITSVTDAHSEGIVESGEGEGETEVDKCTTDDG